MASTEEKPVDDRDALDILESEGKEWEKASQHPQIFFSAAQQQADD